MDLFIAFDSMEFCDSYRANFTMFYIGDFQCTIFLFGKFRFLLKSDKIHAEHEDITIFML